MPLGRGSLRRSAAASAAFVLMILALACTRVDSTRRMHQAFRAPGVAPCVSSSNPVVITNSTRESFVMAAASASVPAGQAIGTSGETIDIFPLEGEGEGEGEGQGEGEGSRVSYAADGNMVFKRDGPIIYRGGQVMPGDLNMYMVWLGSWNRSNAEDAQTMNVLTHLTKYLSDSKWLNINRQYYHMSGGNKVPANGKLAYRGQIVVPGPPGVTSLTDEQLQGILQQLIDQGKLPLDAERGMILVQTSKELGISNQGMQFCRDICGYHNRFMYSGNKGRGLVKYGFTGTMARCYRKCSSFQGAFDTTAPNEPNADSMATILAHEIVEIISDPNFDAWYDDSGYENADICIWRYSNVQYGRRPDGSQYRYTSLFGGRPFLIQDNFSPELGSNGEQLGCVGSAA